MSTSSERAKVEEGGSERVEHHFGAKRSDTVELLPVSRSNSKSIDSSAMRGNAIPGRRLAIVPTSNSKLGQLKKQAGLKCHRPDFAKAQVNGHGPKR